MPRLAFLSALISLSACNAYTGSTKGENGAIDFYEPNTYPDDETFSSQGFNLGIARGARVDVWMTSPGVTSVAEVTIDAPEILSIENAIYPIVLRARSAGIARLRVVQNDGVSDTLPLTVVEADDARIWRLEEDRLFGPSDGAFGAGYALRPGAKIRIAGQPTANGEPLLGFDVFDWSMDENLLIHDLGSQVNTLDLEAVGNSGIATVSTQLGGSFDVATLSAEDAKTLQLRSVDEDLQTVEISAIAPSHLAFLYLTAVDNQGRFVFPSNQDDTDFSASMLNGNVVLLEAKMAYRAVQIRACTGTGTIQFSYLGEQLSVPLEITADVADPECP